MWLHFPSSTPSASAPDMEGLNEDSTLLASEPVLWPLVSGTPTPRPYSWRGWKNRPWIARLSGIRLSHSQASSLLDAWTSSLRDSRANRGVALAPSVEPTTTGGFGPTSPRSFARWDPTTSSWRTLGALWEEESTSSSETWPTSGSMRNGICSALPISERPINGSDFGSWPMSTGLRWPTPIAGDAKQNGNSEAAMEKGLYTLTDRAVRMWPTPTASDYEGNGFRSGERSDEPKLKGAATMWPTPTTAVGGADHNSSGTAVHAGSPNLKGAVSLHDQTIEKDGDTGPNAVDLNPLFVEALMGLPAGWSDYIYSETESSLNAPPLPSPVSLEGQV